MLQVGVVGINYKSAPLALREAFARYVIEETKGLETMLSAPFVLLATCNRFEIYFSASDLYAASHEIVRKLEKIVGVGLRSSFYHYFGHTCFFHLSKVASGLDAAIVGESDIQGQVKKAYEGAAFSRLLNKDLHYIFQKSLRVGKILRTHFFPSQDVMSLEDVIFKLVSNKDKILFVGYSEINRKIMHFFKERGIKDITICTNSCIEGCLPKEAIDEWVNYSVVIVGTKYPGYLLHATVIKTSTRLLFDLGMPRNIDPKLREICKLYSLEEITSGVKSSINMKECEEAIKDLTRRYEKIYARRQILKFATTSKAREGVDVADVFHPSSELNEALESNAKASVWS